MDRSPLVRPRLVRAGLLAAGGVLALAGACERLSASEWDLRALGRLERCRAQPVENAPGALDRPYVVLVSIDGFRHDFTSWFEPPHLRALSREGAVAESLRPVHPSTTAPNHSSLVTGQRPARHGLAANEFLDPALGRTFSLDRPGCTEEPAWYTAEPLWATVSRAGLRTASLFWLGDEASFEGRGPNRYLAYRGDVPSSLRVEQVLAWLGAPADLRPHFVTLYFDAVDRAAHRFGTRAEETRQAVLEVDRALGELRAGLAALGLDANLVVVSDHGMLDLAPDGVVQVDRDPRAAALMSGFQAFGRGPQLHLYLKPGQDPGLVPRLRAELERARDLFRVLGPAEQAALGLAPGRSGDLVLDALPPYSLSTQQQLHLRLPRASHGWDPALCPEMNGIFIAAGPGIWKGVRLPAADVVDVHPFVLALLGLEPRPDVDGRIEALGSALVERVAR